MNYYYKHILGMLVTIPFFTSICYGAEYYSGIDISSYQGTVDFTELASNGCEAVYIRAGEGESFVDPKFKENYEGASRENLDFGFYYYVTATSIEDAETQATTFANLIADTNYSLRPAMDFESFDSLTTDEINEIGLAFLAKLEDLTNVTPAIYSDAYNVEHYWSADFSQYPLWVAEYKNLDNPSTYILSNNNVWTDWSGYQYSDTYTISGVTGDVDGDVFKESLFLTNESTADTEDTSSGTTQSETCTIQKGDTLWSISQTYEISISKLVALNNISNPNLIYIGEILKISQSTSYMVESGNTLTSIANKFQTTVSAIATLNKIKNINLIYSGESLLIP